jgi:ubiquinone/menaquinone biosynthesis C-methylase UbiE
VDPSDPEADAWRVRQQSYRTLERHMRQQSGSRTMTVLDLGAGNGWLSNRFALHGHRAVAVDWLDDERDGLGATRHYGTPLVCVQADFDALPFEAAQFDLVVFNGSLHYAHDVRITLGRARRLVAPGGALVVVDSPFFRRTLDGHAMVEEKTRRFFFEYGISEVVHEGVGFVTFRGLEAAASALRLRGRFYRSRGPLGWQLRRTVGGLRRLRQPDAFGVWVAR